MLIPCPACNSRRYVLGLGGMRQDCGKCGGRGFIEPEAKVEVKARQKPGPKPGGVVCQKREKSLSADRPISMKK